METWQFDHIGHHLEEQTKLLRELLTEARYSNVLLWRILHEIREGNPEEPAFLPTTAIKVAPL